MSDTILPAEQRHREAAARRLRPTSEHDPIASTAERIRAGRFDDHPWVQAFAEFEAALTAAPVKQSLTGEREAIARTILVGMWGEDLAAVYLRNDDIRKHDAYRAADALIASQPNAGGESAGYIEQRLQEGGLKLVSGSPTMLGDEFARFESERVAPLAQPPATEADDDETYQIGVRDGYEKAVQDIDMMTGGDGEYFASTIPGRGCPDAATMKAGIVERFEARRAPPPEVGGLIERLEWEARGLKASRRYNPSKPSNLTNADAVSYGELLDEAAAALETLSGQVESFRATGFVLEDNLFQCVAEKERISAQLGGQGALLVAALWIDGEAPGKEPSAVPTVGFQPSHDPEEDDGNDTVREAFDEGARRGLWLAAEQVRAALSTKGATL